jgi:4-amino-4-deoxy-L-arabinose transferase-like glycosyltransferase
MWLGFALAFMTKGPPGLIYLPVLLLFLVAAPTDELPLRRLLWPPAVLAFLVLGLGWYLWVLVETPALWDYFIGAEVVDRIAGSGFGRNSEWYGWLKVYLPVLLIGTLPWSGRMWRALRSLGADAPRWLRARPARQAEAHRWFLWLWFLVPLVVFCLAQSRLPLYLLPLFPALAILAAAAGPPLSTFQRRKWLWLGAWAVAVIALRFAWAAWPTDKDSEAWAEAIRERAPAPVTEVVLVDHPPLYGLHLHLGVNVEVVSIETQSQRPLRLRYDHDLAQELAEDEAGRVFVARARHWDAFVEQAHALGFRVTPLGPPFHERIIAVVERVSPEPGDSPL